VRCELRDSVNPKFGVDVACLASTYPVDRGVTISVAKEPTNA